MEGCLDGSSLYTPTLRGPENPFGNFRCTSPCTPHACRCVRTRLVISVHRGVPGHTWHCRAFLSEDMPRGFSRLHWLAGLHLTITPSHKSALMLAAMPTSSCTLCAKH